MGQYSAILFDLDNTLIDFSYIEHVSLRFIYQKFFQAHINETDFFTSYQNINQELWQQVNNGQLAAKQVNSLRFTQLLRVFTINFPSEQIALAYKEQLQLNHRWCDGALETLNHLKPYYKLGIITNGLHDVQQHKYKRLSLHQWCQCFIVSESVGIAKPDKAIFEIATEQLAVDTHQCLMVGDSLFSDYQGALNANMDFCWVNNQDYEFPKHLPKPKFEVQSLTELSHALQKFDPGLSNVYSETD